MRRILSIPYKFHHDMCYVIILRVIPNSSIVRICVIFHFTVKIKQIIHMIIFFVFFYLVITVKIL